MAKDVCKNISKSDIIIKISFVTIVTVVTIKYSHINNSTIYYYIYTYIIIELKRKCSRENNCHNCHRTLLEHD